MQWGVKTNDNQYWNKCVAELDVYYKFILCMLLNLLQPSSREDLAISCLLEEDQKDHIDQADWTLKNPNKKTKGSITTYLDFKGNRSRGYFHRSNQKHSNKNRYNPEMLEINEDDCFGQGSHTSKGLKK